MVEGTARRVALFGTLGLVVALAGSAAFGIRHQAAYAEQIRRRCVERFDEHGAWKARLKITDEGSNGVRTTCAEELLVRRPGEYRLKVEEKAPNGATVVSTTIRTREALYTRRESPEGRTELHVVRGMRPSLGVEYDNLLGQTVEAVQSADELRIVESGGRGGRRADKLELGPGSYVWVDRGTGLPVEEQLVSKGRVVHSVTVEEFSAEAGIADALFDPVSLGDADETVVEDLGFRRSADPAAASGTLGFTPDSVAPPRGFARIDGGFMDPEASGAEGPNEAAWVDSFARGEEQILVTQVAWHGASDVLDVEAGDPTQKQVDLAGVSVVLTASESGAQITFVRRGILTTIEADLAGAELLALAEPLVR